MSDPVRCFTPNLEALADEIVAKRKPRGEQFRYSSYPGLRHRTSSTKYRNAEYVQQGFGRVRKLSAIEICEFQTEIQNRMSVLDGTQPEPAKAPHFDTWRGDGPPLPT